jgi:hypothetical protein
MKTWLVAVAGVSGMVLAGCGGKADFTPRGLADGGAAGTLAPGESAGGAEAWDGGSSVAATGTGAARGVEIPPSGGARSRDPRDGGSTSPPEQGGRTTVIGTGGAAAVTGGVGVGGHAAVGGSAAVGGRVVTAGSRATGGSVAAGGVAAVGGSIGTGGSRATGGSAAVGGRVAVGGSTPVGGTGAIGGLVGADGGATSAVGGSTGSIDPPPLPAGCKRVGDPTWNDSYCQVDVACDNDYISAVCSVDYQNTWYCDCYGSNRYLNYVVKGAEPAEACAAVSQLCSSEDPLEVMGPETCVANDPGPQSTDCGLQCERTTELRGGVSATLTSWRYANCFEQNGRQRCECYDGMMSRTFDISNVDGASGCRLALDLCDSDPPIVFDGPTECETAYAYSYPGYCEMQQDCWQSATVRQDVVALRYDAQYSSCYDQMSSGTYCNCYGNQSVLAFQLPGRLANSGACDDARAICTRPGDVVLSGGLECARSYQSAGPDYCDAQITCTQPATWGDLDLIMHPEVWLNCQAESSGAWLCVCSAGTQTVNFEVESAQGWDVCTEAGQRCPDLVDVTSLNGGINWIGPI